MSVTELHSQDVGPLLWSFLVAYRDSMALIHYGIPWHLSIMGFHGTYPLWDSMALIHYEIPWHLSIMGFHDTYPLWISAMEFLCGDNNKIQ